VETLAFWGIDVVGVANLYGFQHSLQEDLLVTIFISLLKKSSYKL
jgi:hypothetical protein